MILRLNAPHSISEAAVELLIFFSYRDLTSISEIVYAD